jgi:hypothetical protein
MPGVMLFDALRKKTLSAALPAARQSRAATLGAHAGTESMLALAGAFRRLKSAFHNSIPLRAQRSGYVMELEGLVN